MSLVSNKRSLFRDQKIFSSPNSNQFMKVAELTAVQVDTGTLQRLEICCRSYKHLMVESGANEQSEEENVIVVLFQLSLKNGKLMFIIRFTRK